jgi:hypothetical protein
MARARIDRREFLTTLVLIPVGAKVAGCGEDEKTRFILDGACGGLQAESSEFGNHTHCLCIPQADLDDPPAEGRQYQTDRDCDPQNTGHTHMLALTQAELTEIAAGVAVIKETQVGTGHTHTFTLAQSAGAQDGGASGDLRRRNGAPFLDIALARG